MDPLTQAIVAALYVGATTGVNETAKKAVADAYEGLKALLKKKFHSNRDLAEAVEKLQAKPDSLARKQLLEEELGMVNAASEPELLSAAHSLLELIKAMPQGDQHIQAAYGFGIAQADRGSTAAVNIHGAPSKNKRR